MLHPAGFPDNADLAISPDNRRIAFSSDRQGRMWDLETGRVLGSWALPVGLQDMLVFQGPDRLLLARAETTDPNVPPYSSGPGEIPSPLRNLRLAGQGNPRGRSERSAT